MLRLANSSFYGLPTRVSNISRVLAALGTNDIKITTSGGGACFPQGNKIYPAILINTADRALYMEKKEEIRDKYFVGACNHML